MTPTELENILSHPPTIVPPTMLKERLLADIPHVTTLKPASTSVSVERPQRWLRRWLPILVPGGLSLACGVAITMQRLEIADLKQSITTLSAASQAPQLASAQPDTQGNVEIKNQASPSSNLETDLARLRDTAANLRSEVASLEAMVAENTHLRQDLANAAPADNLTAEEREALERARERATAIACINNLKQIGLAVRMWSLDHADRMPPNLLAVSNELNTPKVLFCPGDTNRVAAANWNDFGDGNSSYNYFPTDGEMGKEVNRVLTRCPIHGHIGLEDGSVQGYVAKRTPSRLVEKEGSLYFVEPGAQSPAAGTPNSPTGANQ